MPDDPAALTSDFACERCETVFPTVSARRAHDCGASDR